MTEDRTAIPPDNPKQISEAAERQNSNWDISNAPKNYLSLVLSQIGSAAFSFGAIWLITHHLGSDGYGAIVAIIAASQVAQVLVNWTSVAVVRFGVDEFIETEKIARTFWVRLIILVANLAIVLALSKFWFEPLANWLKLYPEAFWLVVIHFSVTTLWIHIQMSLQGVKMPREQGVLQMIERLLIFLSLLALLGVGQFENSHVIICYIAGPVIAASIGLFRIRSYIFSRFSIDRQFVIRIFRYSAPLAPMALVGYFSGSYLDAIFVSKFLSTSDLGIYSVATQINGIALQVPTLANTILIPLFISLEKEEQTHRTERFFKDVLPSAITIAGFLFTVTAFVGFFAVPVVFGLEFSESVYPLWILLAASCAGLPVVFGYSAYSHAISATYMSMFAAISGAITNVTLNFLLIPRFGIIGCAWATLATFCISTLTYAVLLRKARRISLSWILLALTPPILGAISISITENAVLSLITSLVLVLSIVLWKRGSFGETISFVKNFTS